MNTTTEPLELTQPTTLPLMATDKHISTIKRLSGIMMIAVLFTMIFNPEALVIWSQTLPVNWVTDALYKTALQWRDLMDEYGLTIIFDKLREAFRWFQSL
jgi:hypothetical protein